MCPRILRVPEELSCLLPLSLPSMLIKTEWTEKKSYVAFNHSWVRTGNFGQVKFTRPQSLPKRRLRDVTYNVKCFRSFCSFSLSRSLLSFPLFFQSLITPLSQKLCHCKRYPYKTMFLQQYALTKIITASQETIISQQTITSSLSINQSVNSSFSLLIAAHT